MDKNSLRQNSDLRIVQNQSRITEKQEENIMKAIERGIKIETEAVPSLFDLLEDDKLIQQNE